MTHLALSPITPSPVVMHRRRRRVALNLWIPLTPLLFLAAPIVMLAAPFARLSPLARTRRPIRMALAAGALLMSLSGLVVEVEAPRARIRIRIV